MPDNTNDVSYINKNQIPIPEDYKPKAPPANLLDLNMMQERMRARLAEDEAQFTNLRAQRVQLEKELGGSKALFEALRHVHENTGDALDRSRIEVEEELRIKQKQIADITEILLKNQDIHAFMKNREN